MGRPLNEIIHIGVLYFVISLIFVKIQPYFGLVLHVSIFMYDVNNDRVEMCEVVAVIQNIMGSCTDDHHTCFNTRCKVTSKTGQSRTGN
jgi:hypothetical protein